MYVGMKDRDVVNSSRLESEDVRRALIGHNSILPPRLLHYYSINNVDQASDCDTAFRG